ncbi:hypothetical protein [Stutzerimonas urumqiensis]|uniref:hypothetical protein n=1 Tax=Stutzerimonas urumqiensis TaxID=638269 RepID=UPI000EB04F9B|nr:hypothetical protein [Stutzerimonas urumqiensis]
MSSEYPERRRHLALRRYIETLLDDGAVIQRRDPLQLIHDGELYRIANGMMISEGDSAEMTRNLTPTPSQTLGFDRALDEVLRQLEQAIHARLRNPLPEHHEDAAKLETGQRTALGSTTTPDA